MIVDELRADGGDFAAGLSQIGDDAFGPCPLSFGEMMGKSWEAKGAMNSFLGPPKLSPSRIDFPSGEV